MIVKQSFQAWICVVAKVVLVVAVCREGKFQAYFETLIFASRDHAPQISSMSVHFCGEFEQGSDNACPYPIYIVYI